MKYPLATTAIVVAVDQMTKFVAAASSFDEAYGTIGNPGPLAGVLPLEGALLIAASVAALAGLTYVGMRLVGKGIVHPIVVALLAGGAASNIADRLILGYVRDFIWTQRLVFNLADVALLVGAVGFIVGLTIHGSKRSETHIFEQLHKLGGHREFSLRKRYWKRTGQRQGHRTTRQARWRRRHLPRMGPPRHRTCR